MDICTKSLVKYDIIQVYFVYGAGSMRDIIEQKLNDIERTENVTILLAVESGSRAWGFASPDSDYDVRFLYVRSKEFYLRLDKKRDVIEYMLNDVLDINGWDFDKTLRLLHTSNPTLFEWLSSPIVYRKHPFADELKAISNQYFLAKSGLYHYLSMAEGNYRGYVKRETVKLKMYFYVLRPLLACRYILSKKTPPPILFEELMHTELDSALIPTVEQLIYDKMHTPEKGEGLRIKILNDYIEQIIPELKQTIAELPKETKKDWTPLNDLFLRSLEL